MVVHNQAINGLAPADYFVIEQEHKLLEQYLNDLRDTCCCSNLVKVPDFQTCDQENRPCAKAD